MRQTIFVNLHGNLNFPNIWVENTERVDKSLITLQTMVNVIIKKWKDTQATAVNCRDMWNELCAVITNNIPNCVTDADKERKKLIYSKIEEIGNDIAFVCKRNKKITNIEKGYTLWDVMQELLKCTDIKKCVQLYKMAQLVQFNIEHDYTPEEEKEEIDWFKRCTDDEIIEVIKRFKDEQNGKKIVEFYQAVEEIIEDC